MDSINSQGVNRAYGGVLHSRTIPPEKTAESTKETQPDRVLRSSERDDAEDQVQLSLSSQAQNASDDPSRQTYSHLEKTMTSEQLNVNDIRGSLNQLQALMGEAKSFKGSVRVVGDDIPTREPAEVTLPGEKGPYRASDSGKLFSLVVVTADGDRIELDITKSSGSEGSVSDGDYYRYSDTEINFKVDGDLDAGELEALAALTDKLGGLSDTYRTDGWLTLGGIEAFDQSELSGFSLNVSGENTDSFNLDYSVDNLNRQRTLSSNLNGYEYDITVDMDGLKVDKNATLNNQYEQYQTLIRNTAHTYKSGEHAGGVSSSKAASFFLGGMDALFQVKDVEEDEKAESEEGAEKTATENPVHPALKGMKGEAKSLMENYASGLADFTASFSTPVFRPNEEQPGEVSRMTLDIAQTTEVTYSRDGDHQYTQVNQQSEYESRVSQHLGLGGDSVEHANLAPESEGGQSYLYRTDIKSATTSRILNFQDNNQLLSIDELRDQEHIQKNKLVVQGQIESDTTEDLSSPVKNKDTRVDIPTMDRGQYLSGQALRDYMNVKQLDNLVDGNKVELFI